MRCLVIGRTALDVEECKMLNMPDHPPSPTTYLWSDYEKFDGDIITAQSIKYGAIAAGSIELSKRVMWAAENNPGLIWVGASQLDYDEMAEPLRDKMQFLYPHLFDAPVANSGLFTLWLAVFLGYTEIYTVGLDMINIGCINGHPYTHSEATKYIKGEDIKGFETHLVDQLSVDVAQGIIDNSEAEFYKCAEFSRLPCPVKLPPVKK